MMSQSRFQSIYNGLTAVAKKVYSAVPIEDNWTISEIHSELQRQGAHKDLRMTQGVLDSLRVSGVVREISRGVFIRTPIKPKTAANASEFTEEDDEDDMAQKPTPKAAPTAELSPIDKLSTLTARLVGIADSIRALAADIDTAALEIEEQFTVGNADTQKLKQLQQLLKSLT